MEWSVCAVLVTEIGYIIYLAVVSFMHGERKLVMKTHPKSSSRFSFEVDTPKAGSSHAWKTLYICDDDRDAPIAIMFYNLKQIWHGCSFTTHIYYYDILRKGRRSKLWL
jgi:hypothetical protein